MPKKCCWIIVAVFIFSGCATARHAVPGNMLGKVQVSGMCDIRMYSGISSEYFKKDIVNLLEKENKEALSSDQNPARTYSVLAISGGGANGAYGAGLLCGWTKYGTRPVFKIVTGVSTGAIIAPFAFLGSKHDDKLKEFYTKYSTKDIMWINIPIINSFANPRPLKRNIDKYFDSRLLKEIAAEYNNGRRLYVGTTDLDAQRLVIWDMGKIASIGDEKALKLFREIILASASIPIAFPPVYLKVEVGDKTYDEMHVDGGVIKQVFFLYNVVQDMESVAKEKGMDVHGLRYKIYVIRNGYVDSIWKEVPNNLSAIAERTVDTMVNAQGVGDIYQLYDFTKMGKGDFNLAYIPATHIPKAKEPFDPVEMRKLFDLGFEEAAGGYDWKKVPPGMVQ